MQRRQLALGSALALLLLGGAFAGLALLSNDPPPVIEKPMPPFEQELYLRVEARWAKDNPCVDVTTYTNLPTGTAYWIEAQARPMKNTQRTPLNRLTHPQDNEFFRVEGAINENRGVFCHVAQILKRKRVRTNGLLVRARVAYTAPADLYPPGLDSDAEQERRIGERGTLLRGPLVARGNYPIGTSETFVLEPLPPEPAKE